MKLKHFSSSPINSGGQIPFLEKRPSDSIFNAAVHAYPVVLAIEIVFVSLTNYAYIKIKEFLSRLTREEREKTSLKEKSYYI